MDINLDDLLKAKEQNNQMQVNQELQMEPSKEELVKIAQKTEVLSPEDRKRIDEIKDNIDLVNSQTALQFGINAQRNIAEFSDNILSNIRSKDSGYIGDLLSNLVVKVKSFDIEDNKKSSFVKKIPIIGSLVGNAKSMMAEI